jgi:hypothetical protein
MGWVKPTAVLFFTLVALAFAGKRLLFPAPPPLVVSHDTPEQSPRLMTRVDGVAFDTPICVKVGEEFYEAPALWFRDLKPGIVNLPRSDTVQELTGGLNRARIAFWMPGFRAFENWEFGNLWEPGRPRPPEDHYVVRMNLQERATDDDLQTPKRMIDRLLEQQKIVNQTPTTQSSFGLSVYFRGDNFGQTTPRFIIDDVNNDINLNGYCIGLDPRGHCNITVRWRSDRMSIFMLIPTTSLPEWKSIAVKGRELFNGWRVPSCRGAVSR